MEVLLVNQGNLKDDYIFSLRADEVKKQSPVGRRGKPMRFPQSSMIGKTLKVEILQTVCTAYIVPMPGQENYQINFDNDFSCEVSLKQRAGKMQPEAHQPAAGTDGHCAAQEAKAYLEKHQVPQVVQAVLKTVLAEKPADPFAHMASHLASGYPPVTASAERPQTKSEEMEAFRQEDTPQAKCVASQEAAPDIKEREVPQEGNKPKRDLEALRRRASDVLHKGAMDGSLQAALKKKTEDDAKTQDPGQDLDSVRKEVANGLGQAASDGILQNLLATEGKDECNGDPPGDVPQSS